MIILFFSKSNYGADSRHSRHSTKTVTSNFSLHFVQVSFFEHIIVKYDIVDDLML